MKKIRLLLMIIVFNYTFSQTQKAELFFNDGSSVEGYAELTKNNTIKFRTSLNQKADKWTSLMIKSINIEEYNTSVTYEYVSLTPNKPLKLLRVLAEGNVTLYADIKITHSAFASDFKNGLPNMMLHNGQNERVRYYVKKLNEDHPTGLFGSGGFRKKAKTYFSDCIGVIERLKTREFDIHNSSEMINYYNDFCAE